MKALTPLFYIILFILIFWGLISLRKYAYKQGREGLEKEIILAIEGNKSTIVGHFIIVKNVQRESEIWKENHKWLYNKIEPVK